jgi:hypothetical protein
MDQSTPTRVTAGRNQPVLELLGFKCANELVLCYVGNKDSARQTILSGNGQRLGTGLRGGRIVAKVQNDRVKINFLTPLRWGYGPIYEATLVEHENGKVQLCGKLRLTAFETFNCLLIQFGVALWLVECLVVGGYREFDVGFGAALGISVGTILGIMFFPRLSWITRRWKIDALKEHLIGLGFAIH